MSQKSQKGPYHNRYCKLYRAGYRAQSDGVVTRRKLAALQRLGWSQAELARRLDKDTRNFGEMFRSDAPVHHTTARAVDALYDELHLTANETPIGRRTQIIAARKGYPAPLAYDDINDVNEDPKGLRK